ncbi:MAG TPA: ABC transporter ATP-binding protein [Anaerolineae bacterium]|nr:ABC transporter ATP-binding protein [Anaerolineae bacterium]
MRYLWPYRLTALGAFISLVISSLASLVGPRILAWGVDDGVKQLDLTVVWQSCALLVGVAAGRAIFGFLQGYWSEVASQGVAFDLRNTIYDKLQHLSFSYHDQAQTGKLMTRVTSDVEQVRQFVGVGLLQLASALTLLIGSAIILLRMNWQLALAALAVVPFIFAVLGTFIVRVRPRFGEIQRKLGALNTVLQENLAGAKVVHAFAAEPLESQRFTTANRALVAEWQGLIKVFSTSFPLIFFFSNLGTLLVFWLGGAKVITGQMTVGEIIAFNLYLSLLLMPIFILGGLAAGLSRAGASAGRLFEVMDAEIEVHDRPGARELGAVRGRVAFEDVHFRYPGMDKPVLQGVTFAAEPGETVAILGRTGSGKSTVINLIPRFYDVGQGRVTIDGHDVRDLTLDSLRRGIGLVHQDPVLFSGSIRDNIAYGRPDAGDAEVEAAAIAAQAHDFISSLPEGYQSLVGERGSGLSGGQRQRIAIARALLVDPRILIFDDSTSAVDTATEQRIQAALKKLLVGRTAFVIAQRLSTARRASRIVVLDEGRVVANGRHEELLASSAIYCDIVTSQLMGDDEAAAAAAPDLDPDVNPVPNPNRVPNPSPDPAAAGGA